MGAEKKMKRLLFFFLSIFLTLSISAQEVKRDTTSVLSTPQTNSNLGLRLDNVKNFGGFLLDMNALDPVRMPFVSIKDSYEPFPDYSQLFKGLNKVTFGTASAINAPYYSLSPMGFSNGVTSVWGTGQVQTASFKLNNGMTLRTFGDYNADGYRVNRPIEPWRRNNFQGGFEMKSENGKFGISIHVSNGNGIQAGQGIP